MYIFKDSIYSAKLFLLSALLDRKLSKVQLATAALFHTGFAHYKETAFIWNGHLKVEKPRWHEWTPVWCVCLLWVLLSLLIAPSSVRSGRPFISLSSHLCISSFGVSLCHLSTVTSPPRRAAWSGDRLACSWFNNSFVTLRLFVLQRRRLRPAILKIWCAHMISSHACSHTVAYADQANKWRMAVWLRGKYFDIRANRLDVFGHRGFGHRHQCHSPF